MRDPKRIGPMLRRLETIWNLYPDARLGQLLLWTTLDRNTQLWHMEDEQILQSLESRFGKPAKGNTK